MFIFIKYHFDSNGYFMIEVYTLSDKLLFASSLIDQQKFNTVKFDVIFQSIKSRLMFPVCYFTNKFY